MQYIHTYSMYIDTCRTYIHTYHTYVQCKHTIRTCTHTCVHTYMVHVYIRTHSFVASGRAISCHSPNESLHSAGWHGLFVPSLGARAEI